MLKTFVQSVPVICEALSGARSDLLITIRENCRSENVSPTMEFIREVINEDVTYQKSPLDMRNQRTYAVKVLTFLYNLILFVLNSLVWREWTSRCSADNIQRSH